MTSISSVNVQQYASPLDRVRNELSSEIAAGTVNPGDQSALGSAIDDIGAALKSQGEADQSAGSGASPRSDLKAKIDDLIASEVQKGTLTSAQADELKNIFAKASPHHGHGHHGGPHGAGGKHASDGASATSPLGALDLSRGNSGATQSPSSGSNGDQLMQDFLKLVQDAQSSSGYDSNGDGRNSTVPLVLNQQA